jgi:prepilin-type N-terminal cleavage/methylation domain-containing protein
MNPGRAHVPTAPADHVRRAPMPRVSWSAGFTIIELLVVIFIITVLFSISLFALGRTSKTSQLTVSTAKMNDVLQAGLAFQIDERRLPGRFSVRDMGSDDNGKTRGMSMAENMMLDLAGGITKVGGGSGQNPDDVSVHPFAGSSASRAAQEGVWVNVGLIGQPGKSGKGYYKPDAKYFVAQEGAKKQVGSSGQANGSGFTYPDLVDAFGQPILVWIEDENVAGRVAFDTGSSGSNNFARLSSNLAAGQSPARHYWNSNACFLGAEEFGKKVTDMANGSLLGSAVSDQDRVDTLMGLLGNPGLPSSIGTIDKSTAVGSILPTASRGKITLMGPGLDALHLSKADAKGRGQFPGDVMNYGWNFVDPGSTNKLRVDNDGKPAPDDIVKAFDDQVVAGGS